ncbi:hypothetical protein P170DRAFT_407300 [Aspergillus steynii IBT 23096]|uniref:CHAT domain-containing protein n=1 Tax=Aspergillus steynii IBT 23096 TaxID=1392250 RepID=A0A2I2G6X8_9EURO|nr:uncharacterized protein P170DRAFT_407300 [Aspergillus steynii IBT 23096]PLB48631.1 hypothetical protein P170DRAFT_407300 [Aspergillus steynii IBT 23096]
MSQVSTKDGVSLFPPESEEVIICARDALYYLPTTDQDRPKLLLDLAKLLLRRYRAATESDSTLDEWDSTKDLKEAIQLAEEAVDLLPKEITDRVHALHFLSISYVYRFWDTKSTALLQKAIKLMQEVMDLTSLDDPKRQDCIEEPCDTDGNQGIGTVAERAIDQAIQLGKEALAALPSGSPDRAACLDSLARHLVSRFEVKQEIDDLESAIALTEEAVETSEYDFECARYLNRLALSLASERRRPAIVYLNEAIEAAHAAAETARDDNEGLAEYLFDLAELLESRYQEASSIDDLNCAIELAEDAVDRLPKGHRDRPGYLDGLSGYFCSRWRKANTEEDVEAAIRCGREAAIDAVEGNGALLSKRLCTFASLLVSMFELEGDMNDLDEAIETMEEAIDAGSNNEVEQPQYLEFLSNLLVYRYPEIHELDVLDLAIPMQQAILQCIPHHDQHRAKYIHELAIDFLARFKWKRSRDDLETSIQLHREAIKALSEHPESHLLEATLIHDLSVCLMFRFEITLAMSDLDEGVGLGEEAVCKNMTINPHYKFTLVHHIMERYKSTSSSTDLSKAIGLMASVADMLTDDISMDGQYLNFLAMCLEARFKHHGIAADRELAHGIQKKAITAQWEDDIDKAYHLNNWASTLELRYQRTQNQSDLRESMSALQAAIELLPDGNPARVTILTNLALAFHDKYPLEDGDLDTAKALCEKAFDLESGSPFDRARAGLHGLDRCILSEDWLGARSFLEKLVRLLPRLSATTLPRRDQQRMLAPASHIPSDAASMVLKTNGTATQALEILEAGRGIIASFIISSRSDISELKELHPELYSKYNRARDQVCMPWEDQTQRASTLSEIVLNTPKNTYESNKSSVSMRISQRYRDTTQLKELESIIREQEGFERFLLPPTPAALIDLAHRGPIVVFNCTEYRSDALLITQPGGIAALPLERLKFRELKKNVKKFIGDKKLTVGLSSTKAQRQRELQQVLEWLWEIAVHPVLDNLGLLPAKVPKHPSHIWWVTSGQMGLMPLHAAGDSKRSTSDYVVSSYIPTLKALQYAREKDLQYLREPNTRMLITAMPRTVGLNPLGTGKEVQLIRKAVQGSSSIVPSTLTQPSKAEVLQEISKCALVHFACHGIPDTKHPEQGSLFLGASTALEPERLTIQELSNMRHDLGQIAYLSACSTAENASVDLANEAIHIASAFQLLGFPHVIGTLWEADDKCATEVAGAFYESLVDQLKQSGPEVSHDVVAYALHFAVRRVKKRKPVNIIGWAPFVHIGA